MPDRDKNLKSLAVIDCVYPTRNAQLHVMLCCHVTLMLVCRKSTHSVASLQTSAMYGVNYLPFHSGRPTQGDYSHDTCAACSAMRVRNESISTFRVTGGSWHCVPVKREKRERERGGGGGGGKEREDREREGERETEREGEGG